MRTVEEQAGTGHAAVDQGTHLASEFIGKLRVVSLALTNVSMVETMTLHLHTATFTVTRNQEENVEEQSIDALRPQRVNEIVQMREHKRAVATVKAQ